MPPHPSDSHLSTGRKLLILALMLASLGLLYPGVTQPVLTLTGSVEKSKIAELGIELIAGEGADAQTRQMLQAISSFLGFERIERAQERTALPGEPDPSPAPIEAGADVRPGAS